MENWALINPPNKQPYHSWRKKCLLQAKQAKFQTQSPIGWEGGCHRKMHVDSSAACLPPGTPPWHLKWMCNTASEKNRQSKTVSLWVIAHTSEGAWHRELWDRSKDPSSPEPFYHTSQPDALMGHLKNKSTLSTCSHHCSLTGVIMTFFPKLNVPKWCNFPQGASSSQTVILAALFLTFLSSTMSFFSWVDQNCTKYTPVYVKLGEGFFGFFLPQCALLCTCLQWITFAI